MRFAAFAGVACACLLLACTAAPSPPNIVLIITDDQDVEMGSLQHMPFLQARMIEPGTTFDRFYAAVPVCCPSRSTLFSGQYQHNNRVMGNGIPTNCSSPAWQQGPEKLNFGVYLTQAGYRTSFAGKYLNMYGYPPAGGTAHVPPGWANWHGLVGNSIYYDYTISDNGVPVKHGNDYAKDYLPDVVLNRTLEFIEGVPAGKPFLAMLSPPSCHDPTEAAPQHTSLFPGLTRPRNPAFNANTSSQRVHWFQASEAVYGLSQDAQDFVDIKYRRRQQVLASVDDMVESVFQLLESKGVLDNTYFIYTSDNGYHLGDYGTIYDKRQPWDTDTHIPLIVRGPGVKAGATVSTVASMVDLTATVLAMAGAATPAHYDGNSLLPELQGLASSPRGMALVEYVGESNDGGNAPICARTKGAPMFCDPIQNFTQPPYYFGSPLCVCQDCTNNTYTCLRAYNGTSDFRYCEFADSVGTVEAFDYATDPYQLKNVADVLSAPVLQALHDTLAQAVACVGGPACEAVLSQPLPW